MASFPADWGREQLMDLGFVDRAEDLVLYGDVGCGKTHMAIATGMLACERGMPVRFFTASSLVMRLRRARDENRLDAEQPLPDEINEKSGTNPAAGDGVHFERRWCSD